MTKINKFSNVFKFNDREEFYIKAIFCGVMRQVV